MKIAIINGPNLNLLGKREEDIYGTLSFDEYLTALKKKFPEVELLYFQSNVEGELVNFIQLCLEENVQGLILNPAAYTHTSVAIRDAIAGVKIPTIEVHISNVLSREEFRHTSYVGPVCQGTIMGLGLKGYELALRYLGGH